MSEEDFALSKAKETGKPYELASARTETSDTWALPNGRWSVKRHGTTVRVLRAGAWVATDPTLQFATDGKVVPKTSAVSMAFSGGGTGVLLTGVKDGRTLSLTWDKALPKPTLAANVATYTNVLPDVDLQLKAEVEGFSQLLVVKTAAAARHPDLATLKFKLGTVGLNVSADPATGMLSAVNPAGQKVFTASAPMMWDSTTTGDPAPAGSAGAGALAAGEGAAGAPSDVFLMPSGAKDAQMPTTVAGDTLEIKPDQALLTAAGTKYPVYIDPSVVWGDRQNWSWAYRSWPNNSYWNTKEDVRVGYESDTNGLSRSFFQLNTANIKGVQVSKSTFRIRETWSWSCTPTPVELWSTGPISSATTWNRQPGKGTRLDTVTAAKGRAECAAGELEFDATAAARESAAKGWNSVTLGLYASNESDRYQWKRFDPKTMTLETEYNNPPATPSGLGTRPTTGCAFGGAIGNTTVSLYANITDPDAGALSAQFQVFRGDAMVADEWIPALRDRVSTVAIPDAKLPTGNYTWRVRAYDQSLYSGWSETCSFSVDRDRPSKAPRISSTDFPDGSHGWPATTGKARTPGSFTLSANGVSDVVWYGYYTDWDPEVKSITRVVPGFSATIKLTPPSAGPHFVYAVSQDKAGNRSDTTAHLFYAGRSAARDQAGDLNGDGNSDIWSNDSFGSLLTYAGQGNAKFSTTNGGAKFGTPRTTGSGDWGQDGYNDLITLEADPVAKIDRLWSYPNNGLGRVRQDSHREIKVACTDDEAGCGADGDDHWQGASQIVNPGDLNGDGRPDLLVKQGKRLWAYYGDRSHYLDTRGAPVLVGGEDWDKYTVITPGDVNGDKIPDLWLRDNASGDILRSHGKASVDGDVVDLATWGTQTRTKVGSGVTQAAYPQVGSAGDVNGDGVPDLWSRLADNTMVGWNGVASGGTTDSFSARYEIDGVPGSKIAAGTTLASGQELTSGSSKLVMQADGNLVLYTKDGKPLWATGTGNNPGARARMQSDGNLVVYAANGTTALWSSKTTVPHSYAVLHPRGVLVLYNGSGQSLWSSGSQSRPDYNGDGHTDVLARDPNGDVWVYPGTGGTGTSTLGSSYLVGTGFWRDSWTHMYSTDLNNDGRTDIVARTKEGELHLFPGTGGTGTDSFSGRYLIGVGWNGYDLGFGDINGDGRTDVIARDGGGDLWVYPHKGGSGTSTLGERTFIGNGFWPGGWETLRFADFNGDYKTDIVGRTDQGELHLFPNSTDKNGTISFGGRALIGTGWWPGQWNPHVTDLNSDGAAEQVGILNNGEIYDYLPTGRTLIGVGWNYYDVIL
ncbi:FG-GAP-like repeat-containing protein [Streptomyces sp. NBC_01294]|uniref:FG-GAP-like repeat-containing protein n=1 Tax=Streptomyces sp. NBC_01294 TaxID=2903815 RepID=UPI002DDA6948|nr:FG-GAP-like repeat-containing protein [Streptomyces sp. NBC_01294]WRZ57131.1 FG-GAP-like repeat-containing protein [Streptomyces sp. NBC_01294]